MLLQINNGTKDFAGEILFENIQFEVKEGRRIAVIGRNGCGKTTLLKIISGLLTLDKGQIIKGKNVTVGYLAQMAFDDETITVREEFDKPYQDILAMKERMDELTEIMNHDYSDSIINEYARLHDAFEARNGYNYNQEQLTLFTRFGFSIDDLDRPLNTFSGGQKTRIAFVKLLLMKPDILLLDEPTNHLDMMTIEWLEEYLKKYPSAMVIVSHDRMFLDRIVGEVYEFEFGKLNHYSGNYTSFVEQKKIRQQQLETLYHNQQQEIERLSALIEKFRYKKNKAAFAQSKIKYLSRMEKVEKPKEDKHNFKLRFESRVKGGSSVLTAEDLSIGYDKPLCHVTFQIMQGHRLGVIGPNGLGKSTLLKTLIGQVEPLGGDFIFGHQIEVGYFDQSLAELKTDKTILEEIWDEFPEYDHTAIRKVLGQFMFTSEDVFKSCSVLSGGEKVRLALAKLMLSHSNLLILDEPTNHLDIMGKEALEDALLAFEGTVIFVSHDRYFIQKLASDILYIEGDKTAFYPLNYDEYLEKMQGKEIVRKQEETKEEKPSAAKQQREAGKMVKTLERQIEKCEEELEQLRELRYDPEYYHDYQKMNELEERIDDKHNELAHLMERWEEYANQQ